MEPEESSLPAAPATTNAEPLLTPSPAEPAPPEAPYRGLRWIFIGDQGLRAGWSVLVFLLLCNPLGVGILNILIFAAMFHFGLIGKTEEFSPRPMFFAEAGGLLALIVAIELVGLIEHRRILDYNLAGPGGAVNYSAAWRRVLCRFRRWWGRWPGAAGSISAPLRSQERRSSALPRCGPCFSLYRLF